MFSTLSTLWKGAKNKSNDALRDVYSVELIEQKIEEAKVNIKSAKVSLVGLMQKLRSQEGHVSGLSHRIDDISRRAQQALNAGRQDLALEAARAIADLENERTSRSHVMNETQTRVERLRHNIEAAQRRLVDLQQGAKQVKMAKQFARGHAAVGPQMTLVGTPFEEARELIDRALENDTLLEHEEIVLEMEQDLKNENVVEKLADSGFGEPLRITAQDVLARFKIEKQIEKGEI